MTLPAQLPDPHKKKPGEHLEDLRRVITVSIGSVGVATIAAWFISDRLVDWLTAPVRHYIEGPLYYFGPADAFMIRLNASVVAGIVAASPVIVYQLWSFVSPALYSNEKRAAFPWVASTVALFAAGAAFGYFFILPTTLHFMLGFSTESLKPMLSIKEYIDFAGETVLASGMTFDFPVLIVALVAIGLVKTTTLARFRRHAYVAFFVIAALLTPAVAGQFLLAIPMIIFFESSLLIAAFMERSRLKKSAK